MTHLAGRDQFGHRADGLLDRHGWVAPVQVVQVDHVGLQALQALVDALAYVGRVAPRTDATLRAAGRIALDAELGRQRDLVAAAGEHTSDQPLVVPVSVDVGGVDEGHPGVDGVVQRRQ